VCACVCVHVCVCVCVCVCERESVCINQSLDIKACVSLTCGLEDVGVAVTVACGEGLHHAVDLLSFTRQTETPQELPTRRTAMRRVQLLDCG